MSLRFIHVIRGVWISFLLKAELIFHCVCVSHLASFIQTISIDYLLIDTWVASIFWLLRILLLLPWLYNYLFKSLLSLLSGIYPAAGWPGYMVVLYLLFWGITDCLVLSFFKLTLNFLFQCRFRLKAKSRGKLRGFPHSPHPSTHDIFKGALGMRLSALPKAMGRDPGWQHQGWWESEAPSHQSRPSSVPGL